MYNIEIDEGDSTTKSFSITVPKDIEPGQYFIQIIANVDHSEESDRDAARLVIEECNSDSDDDDDYNDDYTNDDDSFDVIEVPPTGGVIYGKPKGQESFFSSPAYLVLLGVLVLIAILMLFVLFAVLLKK